MNDITMKNTITALHWKSLEIWKELSGMKLNAFFLSFLDQISKNELLFASSNKYISPFTGEGMIVRSRYDFYVK
jgi:hypothetical protein